MDNNFLNNTNEQNSCSANSKQYMDDLPPIEIAENVYDTPVAQSPYKPSALQTTVAVILCGIPLIIFIINFFVNEPKRTNIIYPNYPNQIDSTIGNILLAIGFGILIWKANNQATRIGLCSGVVLSLTCTYLSYYPNTFFFENRIILKYLMFFIYFIWIYIYSLIISNNTLSKNNRTWINLLVIVNIKNSLNLFLAYEWWVKSSLIAIVLLTLQFIAYWHFARCEAFSGNYDAKAKGNYRPLNKWFVATIITTLIMSIFL